MLKKFVNLPELLISIVEQYPEDIAIKDSVTQFTWLQLYQRAGSVAEILEANNILPGDKVACVSKKDTYSVICFWGILLCGAVPVLLDHDDGIKTNEVKIKAVTPSAIILDSKGHPPGGAFGQNVYLDFKDLFPSSGNRPNNKKPAVSGFTPACYILLTSGTTGIPKAVQISHANVLHYTYNLYKKIGSPEKVNAAHVSTFSADLGLTNLLMALISGGMLRILNKIEATDPNYFREIIIKDKISLLKISTSHLTSLTSDVAGNYNSTIDTIILGGEKLSWEFVDYISSIKICRNLYNHYGPTETTIGALAFKIEQTHPSVSKTGSVPIGAPIGENVCWLNNTSEKTGELYIAGPGVSLGYLNNTEETSKRFAVTEIAGGKITYYKTGDICKQLEDGNYEFLYRVDRQAKVKGYRIELGEVELAIAGHESVEHVTVSVSSSLGHNILDAYIKPVKKRHLDSEVIRKWLSERLPGYKIPSNFYFYTQAPYNSNGKIDLPALQKSLKHDKEAILPETEALEGSPWKDLLRSSWKTILNKNSIGDYDNFFETGGDSLMAIQLIGRLQRYGYKVHITDLNYNPVLTDFLNFNPPKFDEISPAEEKKKVNRLTFSQNKLLKQRKFDLNEYCQTILLEAGSKINIREMALAIECVVKAHSQLRVAFKRMAGSFSIENQRSGIFRLDTTVLNGRESVILQIQRAGSHLLGKISIDRGELFKAQIFIDPGGKDYLFLACHHLVVDVISWNIIIDELMDYYDQISNGRLPVIIPENVVNEYFSQVSAGELFSSVNEYPELCKPTNGLNIGRNEPVTDLVQVCNIEMPVDISRALLKIEGQQQHLTVSGFMLSAFGNALIRTQKESSIKIDVEFHGRPQNDTLPDLSRSVAWWAVTMPVLVEENKIDPGICTEIIDKKALLANQLNFHNHLGKEHIDNCSGILFNYLGHFPEYFSNASIQLKPSHFNAGPTRSKNAQYEYDLYLTFRFIGDLLFADIQYNSGKFPPAIANRLIATFLKNIVRQLNELGHCFNFANLPLRHGNMASIGQPLYNLTTAGRNGNKKGDKSIFLTGATGFLGLFILRELIRSNKAVIYCLVRGHGDSKKAAMRLREKLRFYFGEDIELDPHRVIVIDGDLLNSDFGIGKDTYEKIAAHVDLILHAAADINLLKAYDDLKQVNITSIRELTKLANTGKTKSVHYISSLAVSGYSTDENGKTFSEDDFDYGQDFVSGYERTKFEGERLVREFTANGGNAKIYRIGHVAADSVSGRFQQNIEQNRVFQILKGIILLKMIPNTFEEQISFSYVDIVAACISGICVEDIDCTMPCIHTENPQYVSFIDMAKMLKTMGYKIGIVEIDFFREAVANFEGPARDKRAIDLMANWIQRYLDFSRNVEYTHGRSLDMMASAGLYFPELSYAWFSRMIRCAIESGYLQRPGVRDSKFQSTY